MNTWDQMKQKFFKQTAIILGIFSLLRIGFAVLLHKMDSAPDQGYAMYYFGTGVAVVLSLLCLFYFLKTKRDIKNQAKLIYSYNDVY